MSIRQAKERLLKKLKMMDEAHKMAEHSKLRFGPPEVENVGETIIGTCSLCGGPVVIPTVYWSINSPTPTCKQCGAFKKETYGPVIDMAKPKYEIVFKNTYINEENK